MAKTAKTPAAAAFTDTKRVKELISLMADNGLTEIELVEDKSRILLRRGFPPASGPVHHAPAPVIHHQANAPGPSAAPAPAAEEKLLTIKSPMVGTYYAAPSPDSPPYVAVGSTVDEKTVVCTIESMKHFNPIAAELRGTIAKSLVSNGQVVEFDQPLFLVKPD